MPLHGIIVSEASLITAIILIQAVVLTFNSPFKLLKKLSLFVGVVFEIYVPGI